MLYSGPATEAAYLLTDKGTVKKMSCREIHSGILASRAEQNCKITLFAATWLQLESIILSEISQTEKENHYHRISLICGTFKKFTNGPVNKTKSHRC